MTVSSGYSQASATIRSEAPHAIINVHHASYILIPQQLVSGEISVAVGYAISSPAAAKQKVVRHTQTMLLRADDVSGPLSLDIYEMDPQKGLSLCKVAMDTQRKPNVESPKEARDRQNQQK
jgi:hypothetical protein